VKIIIKIIAFIILLPLFFTTLLSADQHPITGTRPLYPEAEIFSYSATEEVGGQEYGLFSHELEILFSRDRESLDLLRSSKTKSMIGGAFAVPGLAWTVTNLFWTTYQPGDIRSKEITVATAILAGIGLLFMNSSYNDFYMSIYKYNSSFLCPQASAGNLILASKQVNF
jgi:hypothetical protein